MADAVPVDSRSGLSATRRWAIGLVLVVVALAGAMFALSGRLIRSTVESPAATDARKAFATGDSTRAKTALDRWLATNPESAEAYYLRGRLQLADGRPQDALNSFGKALDRGYPQGPLSTLRAVVWARAQEYDKAEPILSQALATSDVPQPEAAEALARLYLARFQVADAQRAARRWVKDAPSDARAYLLLDEIEERLSAEPAARIQNLRAALQRDPKLLQARLSLARVLFEEYRLDEASKEFATYRDAQPEDPEGWLGAGRVAAARGDLADAKRDLDHALSLAPEHAETLKARSLIALREHELDAARMFLEKELAIAPHDFESRFNLARVLNELKFGDEAKRQTSLARKDKEEFQALFQVRNALVANPTDRDLRFKAATLLFSQGHEEEALRWTEFILRDNPSDVETHRLLERHYRQKGDLGRANYHKLLIPDGAAK